MRTTVVLDDDVAAAVVKMQREQGVGLSAALNQLARQGLVAAPARTPFVQRTSKMRARIDVSNVAEVLELLDGPAGR